MSATGITCSNCVCTMENNLRSLALMNTKGVHSMVMGRKHYVSKAIHSYKQALQALETVRATDFSAKKCCTIRKSISSSSSDGNCIEVFNSSQVAQMESQQDSFYVYNRAVLFKPLSDMSSIGLTFYTAVIQFNLALAYHVKAKTASGNPKNSSQRALRNYKNCLKTLRELGICSSMADRPPYPGGGEAMIYLRLAALNNMAHMYSLTRNFVKVDATLARVFKFTVAQRPVLFTQSKRSDASAMEDCSSRSAILTDRQSNASMNSAFVNEVLLNVMVSGPVAGAGAA